MACDLRQAGRPQAKIQNLADVVCELFPLSALFSSTSPCPFLNRLPSNYLKNYGNSLVKIYGEHCPAVNRAAAAASNAIHQQVQEVQVSHSVHLIKDPIKS